MFKNVAIQIIIRLKKVLSENISTVSFLANKFFFYVLRYKVNDLGIYIFSESWKGLDFVEKKIQTLNMSNTF